MKIVVHNTYKSVKELQSIFIRPDDDDLDDDMKLGENETAPEGDDLIKLENDLQEDIVQLAHEEMGMIAQEEDEYGADNRISDNRKPAPMENLAQTKPGLGETEDEAICLSDDEDYTSSNRKESAKAASSQQPEMPQISVTSGAEGFNHSKSRVLHKYRFYNQYFEGSSYGMQLLFVGQRLAVASNRFGKAKPALGDVLVAVNGYRLPLACRLEDACRYMKQVIN